MLTSMLPLFSYVHYLNLVLTWVAWEAIYKITSLLDVIIVTCSPKNRATSSIIPRSPLVLHSIHVTLHIAYNTVYVKHKQVTRMFQSLDTQKKAHFNSNPIPSSTSRDMNWSDSGRHWCCWNGQEPFSVRSGNAMSVTLLVEEGVQQHYRVSATLPVCDKVHGNRCDCVQAANVGSLCTRRRTSMRSLNLGVSLVS